MPANTALRERLEQRNAELETGYYVLLTEAQMLDVASGYVPNSVKAMARTMLDWIDEDQRKADANLAADARARSKRTKKRHVAEPAEGAPTEQKQ